LFKSNLSLSYQSTPFALSRDRLTNNEIRAYRLRIFTNERQTQMEWIRRVDKIEIDVQDPIQSISTSYNYTQHLSSVLVDQSCLAIIDENHVYLLFKSNYNVELSSFPPSSQVQYGSFAYDSKLNFGKVYLYV
jgi:hypothetical protein